MITLPIEFYKNKILKRYLPTRIPYPKNTCTDKCNEGAKGVLLSGKGICVRFCFNFEENLTGGRTMRVPRVGRVPKSDKPMPKTDTSRGRETARQEAKKTQASSSCL